VTNQKGMKKKDLRAALACKRSTKVMRQGNFAREGPNDNPVKKKIRHVPPIKSPDVNKEGGD